MDVTKFQSKMNETISKEIEKQTIGKDLPRLIKNVTLVINQDSTFNYEESDKELKEQILDFLKTLHMVTGFKKDGFEESFEKSVDLDDLTTLNTFLKDTYGEKNAVINFLKCMTQSMVINVILFTKPVLQLKHGIFFKDAKGGQVWKIEFINGEEIQLVHTRKEQVYAQNKGQIQDLFQFVWKLIFSFDKKFQVTRIKVELTSKDEEHEKELELISNVFNAQLKMETKKEITFFRQLCSVCKETVYTQEMVEVEKKYYHQKCFKCSKCKRQLNMGNFYLHQGSLFCFGHYKEAQMK